MKNIFNIYKNDLHNIATNWVAAVLIGGLIFLPSLYAWFNIKAMWDPYSETGNLPVAIVNEDKGAEVRGQTINAGAELVGTLKDNQTMQWHFESREKALSKLEYGDYFAMIVIPSDFSSRLASVVSDRPEKAQIEYFVNEKLNSVAPKITEKGATVIAQQISSKFTSTVNGVIFGLFNEIGVEMEKDMPDIERFEQYIFTLEKDLPDINKTLEQTLADAHSAQSLIGKAEKMVPEAQELTENGIQTVDRVTGYLDKADARLKEMSPQINADLDKVSKVAKEAEAFLGKVQNINIDLTEGKKIKEALHGKVASAIDSLGAIENSLTQVQRLQNEGSAAGQDTPEVQDPGAEQGSPAVQVPAAGQDSAIREQEKQQVQAALEKVGQIRAFLQEAERNAAELDQFVTGKEAEFTQAINDLHEVAANTSVRIDAFAVEYRNTIEPTVMKEMDNARNTLSGAKGILSEIRSAFPQIQGILGRTSESLNEGTEKLEYAEGQMPFINDRVKKLAGKIRDIQEEADLNGIIQLLQNDPSAEKSFFEEPVKLSEHSLFPIKNYGTGMTPFYTVLAIWVGALLLISLLSTEVVKPDLYSGRDIYLGKLLTFLSIGFLQTLIVTAGDMLILGVTVQAPFWIIVFALFISLVFMLIVYTLVSVFGNVGKAMAIVLLVLQIAGSGGTYPVVLLPPFFQAISPFLPFTYAVDLMREAVGGIVWRKVGTDLAILSVFGLAALALGAFFKEPINRRTKKLLKKSHDSGVFH